MSDIKELLINTSEETAEKTDWTKAWSKTYPVLGSYQEKLDISFYETKIRDMLNDLMDRYGYSEKDAMLVLKDILYHEYKKDRK